MDATDPLSTQDQAGPQAGADPVSGPMRVPRWVGPVFAILAVLLIPWTIYLASTLPARARATHYALAWAGFDVALIAALAWTGYLTWHHHLWMPIAASVTATMLLVDAWFDVTTAPDRSNRVQAIVSAAVLEVPLALGCFWLAVHAQNIIKRRIMVRARREARRERGDRRILGRIRPGL